MDPGFSESEVAMMTPDPSEDMADRLDLSVSSIDMTGTSLAVHEEKDSNNISGIDELGDGELPETPPENWMETEHRESLIMPTESQDQASEFAGSPDTVVEAPFAPPPVVESLAPLVDAEASLPDPDITSLSPSPPLDLLPQDQLLLQPQVSDILVGDSLTQDNVTLGGTPPEPMVEPDVISSLEQLSVEQSETAAAEHHHDDHECCHDHHEHEVSNQEVEEG
ncbi:uncharacterized protein LOC127910907 isoform X13 [Oncorhynchus keta]|uniref:uncharacterized protein LOC127910907 isoform X1 n=1 Tax=Oncorhynchus keta TaxID=8018 RepID=UPI00227C1CBC|nr:uncharacterized protein LOC127910907 isoform X1 [Oncorhynchus keta]XP_052331980.1 uncharacterized protein LOC127910907 isoform X2 [Oncorhynchus keta]XP_052331981.1 uncharacterized protein LOC127910907 isoform X3 [Oncorhynchus keta]XP_052331982.1 uncharacterized protein LOC127910907 isoform X4 [Oncorhynchus keta]XP_052331983.1 uncharacterized protein LOC127910907 isoform X5 [Oncorhynchus keta]XP_052331984.1 uncharacterized protein LOC127910907 isoform X6 [Oncorhynchus keta]XP_052331985.1 un